MVDGGSGVRDEAREPSGQESRPEHTGPLRFNHKDFGFYCE